MVNQIDVLRIGMFLEQCCIIAGADVQGSVLEFASDLKCFYSGANLVYPTLFCTQNFQAYQFSFSTKTEAGKVKIPLEKLSLNFAIGRYLAGTQITGVIAKLSTTRLQGGVTNFNRDRMLKYLKPENRHYWLTTTLVTNYQQTIMARDQIKIDHIWRPLSENADAEVKFKLMLEQLYNFHLAFKEFVSASESVINLVDEITKSSITQGTRRINMEYSDRHFNFGQERMQVLSLLCLRKLVRLHGVKLCAINLNGQDKIFDSCGDFGTKTTRILNSTLNEDMAYHYITLTILMS